MEMQKASVNVECENENSKSIINASIECSAGKNEEKNTISNGINIMIQSFKQAIEESDINLLKLPDILPVEKIEVISE